MNEITKISITEDVTLITLRNSPSSMKFISHVFDMIAKKKINVDMISQTAPVSEHTNISFTLPDESLGVILDVFSNLRAEYPGIKYDISTGNCKISLFGEPMRDASGVAASVFDILARIKIDIQIISTSEIDISLLIPKSDLNLAVEAFEGSFGIKTA